MWFGLRGKARLRCRDATAWAVAGALPTREESFGSGRPLSLMGQTVAVAAFTGGWRKLGRSTSAESACYLLRSIKCGRPEGSRPA